MSMTLSAIAELVGGTLHGDGAVEITGVNGIEEARPGELVFVRDAKYAALLPKTRASAVLIRELPADCALPAVLVPHPDIAFLQVLKHFEQAQASHPEGIHPTAAIHPTATLGANVAVGAHVCIEANAVIGDNAVIYAGVYVGNGSSVGRDSILYPNVVVREQCTIGARCILHSSAIIGSDGFGFAPMGGQWIKVPQIGRVVIGDDVEIGSATCVDRATFGETRIGTGTKIDNLCQLGHNVVIGEHCAIAGTVGIAGSARIGNGVRIGASSGIAGHITIGDGATVAARAGVTSSVEPGAIVSGFPAIGHAEHRRVMVGQRRVPELLRRMKELERHIQALEDKLNGESADHR
jgi:UDP-3-O-[3-hydroxymyristoyl] glucosamine N-acyltransferase